MLYNTISYRPYLFKKIPRKTNQEWKSDGARAERRSSARRGEIVRVSTESERTIRFRVTTHAERANQSGSCSK